MYELEKERALEAKVRMACRESGISLAWQSNLLRDISQKLWNNHLQAMAHQILPPPKSSTISSSSTMIPMPPKPPRP
jgi:hypothetical protein